MTEPQSNRIEELLLDLEAATSSDATSDDWISQANDYALASLRDEVHTAVAEKRFGVTLRLHGGEVDGHFVPAHRAFKIGMSFNDIVVNIANSKLKRPYKTITDDIRTRLGLHTHAFAPGSVELELVALDQGHSSADPDDENPPLTGLEVVDTVASSATREALDLMRWIIRQDGNAEDHETTPFDEVTAAVVRQLSRLAKQAEEADMQIDFTPRFSDEMMVLKPSTAKNFRALVSARHLDVDEVVRKGEWLTGSHVRDVFDLREDDGNIISGTVPRKLRGDSARHLNEHVEVTLVEQPVERFGSMSMKYTLKRIGPGNPPNS